MYIAGHRIGFPGTRSNLAFYDLEDLKNGDKVYLEDAEGRKYTYEVYEKLVVEPANLSVIKPDRGQEHHQPADLHAARLHQACHLQGRAQGHRVPVTDVCQGSEDRGKSRSAGFSGRSWDVPVC